MRRYILLRMLAIIPTMLGVSVAIFVLMRMVPGTVVQQMLGLQAQATPETISNLRAYFGLDQPLYVQYLTWIGGLLHGNLGVSWVDGHPVAELIAAHFPVTLDLTVFALLIAIAIGLPTGIYAAVYQGTRVDTAAAVVSLFGLSVPEFWQGSLYILFLSVLLNWTPSTVVPSLFTDPLGNMSVMILPAICLGTVLGANIARLTRSSMLEVLSKDYVRTARAKGVTPSAVLYVHALKNAIIPVLTIGGIGVGYLLGGAVIVEQVFTLPGMGRLLLDSVGQRDYPVVQSVILVIALTFMLANLVVDVLYAALNPRVRY